MLRDLRRQIAAMKFTESVRVFQVPKPFDSRLTAKRTRPILLREQRASFRRKRAQLVHIV